jgi:hypothetical protein
MRQRQAGASSITPPERGAHPRYVSPSRNHAQTTPSSLRSSPSPTPTNPASARSQPQDGMTPTRPYVHRPLQQRTDLSTQGNASRRRCQAQRLNARDSGLRRCRGSARPGCARPRPARPDDQRARTHPTGHRPRQKKPTARRSACRPRQADRRRRLRSAGCRRQDRCPPSYCAESVPTPVAGHVPPSPPPHAASLRHAAPEQLL